MNVFSRSAILFLFAMVFVACDQENNNDNNQVTREVVVETLTISPYSFEERIRVTGTVEAIDDAMISSEVSGRVQSIVDRGSEVQEGAVIVSLDDRIVRSSLEMARANYELAEDALQRQEPLLRDSIISTLEYNQARSQRDQARSQLDQAQKQLSDSRIEAPFRGRVEERRVSSGELVSPGMPVLRLVNTERVRINAGVPERYINDIREGAPVSVLLRSYSGEELESSIHYAGSMIIPETRTFPIEVVMENAHGLLKPEMTVNLGIIRNVWDDALVVPRTALIRDEDGVQIYVIQQDGDQKIAVSRRVRTGVSSGSLIVIEEGLEPDEEVVVIGQTNLSDGDGVRIRNRRSYEAYQ